MWKKYVDKHVCKIRYILSEFALKIYLQRRAPAGQIIATSFSGAKNCSFYHEKMNEEWAIALDLQHASLV